jgi:hypothetical protein
MRGSESRKPFTEVDFWIPYIINSLFLSLLLLISTLYQPYLELSREIFGFLCQEILTKLFCIFGMIGTLFATCRKSLRHKHLRQNRPARLALSPYRARVYVNCRISSRYRNNSSAAALLMPSKSICRTTPSL